MLQRAASNAYSWWWASHIRTKQSKWLEQNLQDMEERVTTVLKLIEEDGDSFAKRAEMYFKKRPELVHFVEESYRAYRALAERYDHISSELQNANTTIASVFPDQVPFTIDDDDDYGSPSFHNKSLENSKGDIPSVPKLPVKDLKGLITSTTKKMMQREISANVTTIEVAKSGLTKAEGIEEIDRLHKRILSLQTEKEFANSCYESGLAKYWEIDNEMKQMQEKIASLEDEFGEGRIIEDHEARNVMAKTALKSCKETLVELQEKQDRSIMEVKVEQRRIEDAEEKLVAFKNEFCLNEFGPEKAPAREGEVGDGDKKMKEKFEVGFGESLSVAEMEDKIDELVNKVIELENAVSSQSVLIERLRAETDELQSQIQALEVDKGTLIDGRNYLMNKLREMEEKINQIQDLNRGVKDRNNDLKTQFTEAHCNIVRLSEKLHSLKPDEVESSKENTINDSDKMPKKANACKVFEAAYASEREESPAEVKSEKCQDRITENKLESQASSMRVDTPVKVESKEKERETEDEPGWKQLFLKGMENREKNLLMEYTTILRNYKDTKKKLMEVETNNQNGLFEIMLQLKELKNSHAMKDEEILSLRRELNLSQTADRYAEPRVSSTEKLIVIETSSEKEENEDIGVMLSDQSQTISEIEEKFRINIDELLNENLDFWFRFSTAFQEVSKFETGVKDLQAEITKLDERKMQDGSCTSKSPLISDVRPLYKHLKEVQRELNSWVERSLFLKDELKNRSSSLCDIQEEITKALKESAADDEFKFTSYQAAKFQGEILNMKQENNKVSEELQAGLDHVKTLQLEVERTLAKLREDWELSKSKNRRSGQLQYSGSGSESKIPLRSFIFGVKSKKHKTSIFACVPTALHRKYAGIRSGLSSNR